MARKLIVCSDGTGNSAGKLNKTNVWRLYQAVDLRPPTAEADDSGGDTHEQIAFYDDGVGTSSFKPLAILGGALGVGLARNVVDLYIFLSRAWQPGDRIYAFGFSRGAFTIRVLLGLLMSQGLLRCHGSERDLERLAWAAYRRYRAQCFHSLSPLVWLGRRLRDLGVRVLDALLRRTPYDPAACAAGPDAAEPLKVEFVGLWDTVDAYGLPVDELTRAIDLAVWPLTMRDYNLSPRVLRACHVLALDDERHAFWPRLWNEVPQPGKPGSGVPGANAGTRHLDDERISQVWFAGVHSNVGGGYPDDALAHVSLLWMMRQAQARGLRFEDEIRRSYEALADEDGPLLDSRHGLAGYYRYRPRHIARLAHTGQVQVARTKVHESALRRIRAGQDGYAPIGLPRHFAVVHDDGRIVDVDTWLDPQRQTPAAPGSQPWADAAQRAKVDNTVWWRRVAYFSTVAATLALLVLPLLRPGSEACSGDWCFLAAAIRGLGLVLPGMAEPWLRAFASDPGVSVPLMLAVVAAMLWGGWLQARIGDRMRALWYGTPALRPPGMPAPAAPRAAGPLDRAVTALRTHVLYQGLFALLREWLLPAGFLLVLAMAAWGLASQVEHSRRMAHGELCQAGAEGARGGFATAQPCWDSGQTLREGATYRIRLEVPAAARWADETIPAGPQGFECPLPPGQAVVMGAATLLRRHVGEDWFRPIARIGARGSDEYPLLPDVAQAAPADRCAQPWAAPAPKPGDCAADSPAAGSAAPFTVFESTLVARSSGRLFLYVNDAVDLLGWRGFYGNNLGCARVSVHELRPATR